MPDGILVMKFGGTSVGTISAVNNVKEIIKDVQKDWSRIVIVLSALSGVTNLLIDCAEKASKGQSGVINKTSQELRARHTDMIQAVIRKKSLQTKTQIDIDDLIDKFINLTNAIRILGESTPRALDAIVSLGERFSVRIIAAAFQSNGIRSEFVDGEKVIITDGQFQNAHPNMEMTERAAGENLNPLLNSGVIPVVTGFIGATQDGITTTLGRGGSDYSAALIGAALGAKEVWIWTDVDGVMTADPRVVPNARTIEELSYREIAELAYFGAKVLHPKTIRPVIEAGIGLRICNTFDPHAPGTMIVENGNNRDNGKIKAVTIIRDQQMITLEGRGMLGIPGVAARTFGAVASTGTSVTLISQASSEQSICFTTNAEYTPRVLESLKETFSDELQRRDIDKIWATSPVAIVTVVGAGMRHTPGIAGRVFSALGDQNVNVIAIAQGSSEVSISLVVDDSEAEDALLALHKLTE